MTVEGSDLVSAECEEDDEGEVAQGAEAGHLGEQHPLQQPGRGVQAGLQCEAAAGRHCEAGAGRHVAGRGLLASAIARYSYPECRSGGVEPLMS